MLWAALALVRPIGGVDHDYSSEGLQVALIIFGALASGTRGYPPEASNLWVLETFATDQRGLTYSAVNVVFNLSASLTVLIMGQVVDATDYDPLPLLMLYAAVQLCLGIFASFLPNETANKELQDLTGS